MYYGEFGVKGCTKSLMIWGGGGEGGRPEIIFSYPYDHRLTV